MKFWTLTIARWKKAAPEKPKEAEPKKENGQQRKNTAK